MGSMGAVPKARLRVSQLIRAARIAEDALPLVAESLVTAALNEKDHSLKERNGAARTLLSMAEASPRLRDHLGLREARSEGEGHPLIAVLGENVTVAVLRGLTADQREELLLRLASGDKEGARKLLPLQADVVTVADVQDDDEPDAGS
jgi:hypothetical protein